MTTRLPVETTLTRHLLPILVAAACLGAGAATAQSVDTATISGLGARNIGSAAMSGRIAAIAGRQEADGKVTLFIGAAAMSGRIAAIAGRQEADGKVTLFIGAASGGDASAH